VNDGISQEHCSCQNSTVADAARQVLVTGKGALLAIKCAYQNIPVTPEDCHVLGFQWNGFAYVEMMHLFGLRLAPFLLTEIMRQNGVTWGLIISHDWCPRLS